VNAPKGSVTRAVLLAALFCTALAAEPARSETICAQKQLTSSMNTCRILQQREQAGISYARAPDKTFFTWSEPGSGINPRLKLMGRNGLTESKNDTVELFLSPARSRFMTLNYRY
jgi:hypothetical protein